MTTVSFAQDLSAHKWKHRVILIYAETLSTDTLQQQLYEFESYENELRDRRIVRYVITKSKYQFTNYLAEDLPNKWKHYSGQLFDSAMKNQEEFKFILIGLDGTIKLESDKVLSVRKIMDLIDSMPMRKAELRRNRRS